MGTQIAVLPQYSLASALEMLQYRLEMEKSRIENAMANPASVTLPPALSPSRSSSKVLKELKEKEEEPRGTSWA
jgi:hypothetical protein